ncbi:MAG: tetratricopeptide repeat protein [Candidatus Kaelpia imicola]|nr:tetratricopeptide repeat protein [Candidatus Kaelpia imicola]
MQKIGFIIFGVILSLFFLEILLYTGGFLITSIKEYKNKKAFLKKADYCVLCLGESTTDRQWPVFLGEILNNQNTGVTFKIVDKGMTAVNTRLIAARLEEYLNIYNPDIVVTMMGINDGTAIVENNRAASKPLFFLKQLKVYKLVDLLLKYIRYTFNFDGQINEEERLKGKIAQYPLSYNTYAELGYYYWRDGRSGDAERMLKKSIELGPKNDMAYAALSSCYLHEGRMEEGETVARKAIEINPMNKTGFVTLGWCLLNQGKHKEAEELLRESVDLPSCGAEAYFALGMCYINQKKYEEASKLFKQAIIDFPNNDRFYSSLADCYYNLGQERLSEEHKKQSYVVRRQTYNPVTYLNYNKLKIILAGKGVYFICVQYPMMNIESLKKMLRPNEGIIFVDNEMLFKNATEEEGYDEYFTDSFAGDFGHCTVKGNKLLAENIAKVILKELF